MPHACKTVAKCSWPRALQGIEGNLRCSLRRGDRKSLLSTLEKRGSGSLAGSFIFLVVTVRNLSELKKEETPLRRFASEFAESNLALIGLAVLVLVLLLAVFAPVISPQNPYDLAQLDVMDGKLAPGEKSATGKPYLLGTDDQGRDMLSGIFYGLRISLFVGVASTLVAAAIGLSFGLMAAYFGGWVDTLIMRVVDIQLSFPAILLALILLAVFGQGVDKVIIALITCNGRTTRGRYALRPWWKCKRNMWKQRKYWRFPRHEFCFAICCRIACRR